MHRTYYFTVICLALAALVISLLMLPSQREVALMTMEDKYFDSAFERYKSLYQKGDRSVNVIVPLSKLYLQHGEVEVASELLEEFMEKNPGSVEAYEQLGILYQYSQKPDHYAKTLEKTYELKPSAKLLHQLSDIYNYNAQYEKQIKTLEELIEHYPKEVTEKDYRDLAYLYSGQENIKAAATLLDSYITEKQEDISSNILSLTIAMLLDIGKSKRAMQHAQNYLESSPGAEDAMQLAQQFQKKTYYSEALALLTPYQKEAKVNTILFAEIIAIKLDLGRKKEVREQLVKYLPEGVLSEKSIATLIDIALDLEDAELLEHLEKIYPQNTKLKRELAAVLYFKGEYTKARNLFAFYLKDYHGDFRSHYYYAELLTQIYKKREANKHYRKAQQTLVKLEKKEPQDEIIEAHLLFRQNQIKKSIEAYERLLKKYPRNEELHIDFVDILMDIGHYDKAERVLSKVN